jgi:hypothetical protein
MMTCFCGKVDFVRGGPARKRKIADLDFREQLAEVENCEDSSIFRVSNRLHEFDLWTEDEVIRWVDFREVLNRKGEG